MKRDTGIVMDIDTEIHTDIDVEVDI